MKIAITGSEGFIGRSLVSRLLQNSYEVIKIDLLFGQDILDYEQLFRIPEFDLIIHLASRLIVSESYALPHSYYQTNVLGTLNILELCRIRNKRIIFFSSYVYGHPIYQPIDERHPTSPFNPYAQSKILSEVLCQAYSRDYNVPVIIFRPFNIYGPGQNSNFLIPNIIRQSKTGIVHLKDPRPKRDFIYINDVISACMSAIVYDQSKFEIFNIGFGKSSSIPEIIELLQPILNMEIKVIYNNELRENEVLNTICDNKKVNSILNWVPTVTLEQGLKRMVKFDTV